MNRVIINGNVYFQVKVGETKFKNLSGSEDGYILEYDNDMGLMLFALLNNPTKVEIENMTGYGKFGITLTKIKDYGIVCVKAGNLQWGDCPFEPRLYEEEMVFPDICSPEEGLTLNIVLVDPSREGIVVGLKVIGLGHDFSVKFIDWCKQQQGKPFDEKDYKMVMDAVAKVYTPTEIAKDSMCKWILN